MSGFTLPPVRFTFGQGQTGPDKLRGLLAHGPFQRIATELPRFGFVFPTERREDANKLFIALKNGIGLFRGVENTFRFGLSTNQVFPVPVKGVDVSPRADHSKNSRLYADAIISWHNAQTNDRPSMFFVLHPRTVGSERSTPYYECKALLLREGILSQNVTLDLIANKSQFEWSAANIALAAFVKLGGIPWVVQGEELEKDLIIGLGKAYVYDSQTRQTTGYVAFTACFSARGPLRFISLANVASSKEQYLASLRKIVADSLEKSDRLNAGISSLTLHAPKEMQREEMEVIRSVVRSHIKKSVLEISVFKVTDESSFFAIDDRYQDGVPKRGTCIQVSDREYMVYTEGRDERETWSTRIPVALRVAPAGPMINQANITSALRRINDLSQVNWRGFNARSRPISIYYASLIAHLLSHVPSRLVGALYKNDALTMLQERMWFV